MKVFGRILSKYGNFQIFVRIRETDQKIVQFKNMHENFFNETDKDSLELYRIDHTRLNSKKRIIFVYAWEFRQSNWFFSPPFSSTMVVIFLCQIHQKNNIFLALSGFHYTLQKKFTLMLVKFSTFRNYYDSFLSRTKNVRPLAFTKNLNIVVGAVCNV